MQQKLDMKMNDNEKWTKLKFCEYLGKLRSTITSFVPLSNLLTKSDILLNEKKSNFG